MFIVANWRWYQMKIIVITQCYSCFIMWVNLHEHKA